MRRMRTHAAAIFNERAPNFNVTFSRASRRNQIEKLRNHALIIYFLLYFHRACAWNN